MAPEATASSVNRYAVPIRTPTATPRSARDADSVATIAADRASWMPPANRMCSSSALTAPGPVAASAPAAARTSFPTGRSWSAGRRVRRTRGPRRRNAAPAAQKLRQQPGRRNVQIGWDAFFFQLVRLIGSAAGDENEGRTDSANRRDLFAAHLRRSEAENAGAPRPAGEPLARVAEQFLAYRRGGAEPARGRAERRWPPPIRRTRRYR